MKLVSLLFENVLHIDVYCFVVCMCFLQEQKRLKALDEEFHRKLAIEMKKVIVIFFLLVTEYVVCI